MSTLTATTTITDQISSIQRRVKAKRATRKTTLIKTEVTDELTSINARSKAIKKRTPAVKKTTPKMVKVKKETTTKKPAVTKKKIKRKVESYATQEEITMLPEMRGRIERARRERLFIIERTQINPTNQEIKVTGSTGNLYKVAIGPRLSCECGDYRFRRRHCKHILMVLLKMFHASPASQIFQTMTPDTKTLQDLFSTCPPDASAMISDEIRLLINRKLHGEEENEEVKSKTQRRPLNASDCPVCCDEFEEVSIADIIYCLVCGNNIHKICFNRWKTTRGSDVTCVYCRSPWEGLLKQKKKPKVQVNHEGYTNFGAELGLPTNRDTTTYRDYPSSSYIRF